MIRKFFILLLLSSAILSCKKNVDKDTYIASAAAIIKISTNEWSGTEAELKNKQGYQYTKLPDNPGGYVIATATLPAIDDSNRAVQGSVLLNIAPGNEVSSVVFETKPLAKKEAYAMILNYNHSSRQILPVIHSELGIYLVNGNERYDTVEEIVTMLENGLELEGFSIMYFSNPWFYYMEVTRQNDGLYKFRYTAEL